MINCRHLFQQLYDKFAGIYFNTDPAKISKRKSTYKNIINTKFNNITIQETPARYPSLTSCSKATAVATQQSLHLKTAKLKSPARRNKNNNNNISFIRIAARQSRDVRVQRDSLFAEIFARHLETPRSFSTFTKYPADIAVTICQARTTRMSSGVRTARGPVNWVMNRSHARRIYGISSRAKRRGRRRRPGAIRAALPRGETKGIVARRVSI